MKTKRTMKYELYISNGTTAGTDIPASCVDNGWLDVSSLINSKDTKIEYNVCNESFKSMADSASIVLRYADSKFFSAVAKLLIDNGNTDILLRINGTTWIYSKETTDTVEIGGASVDGEVVTVNDATILDFGAEATGNRMVIPSGKASISGNTAIISNDMISVNNHLMDIESATLVLNDGALDYTEAVSSHKTECYFLGYIPNGMTSYSTAFLPQNITLSAKSLEEKLADINYTSNVSLVGEKASVIANMMLSFAGSKLKTYKDANNVHYNVYDVMANYFYLAETTLYATVRYFAMTSDDKKTVKTIIDDIIFECGGNPGIGGSDDGFGWALDFDHKTGMFAIKKTTGYLSESYINALKQNSAKRVHYSTKNQLKLSRSTNKKDGIAIKYYSAKTLLNNVVYVENIDNSIAENKDSTGRDEDGLKAGVWKGVTVYTDSEVEQSGGTTGTDSLAGKNYYPNDSDINATYQEYKKELLDKAYQEGKNRLQSDNIDLVFVYENSTTLEVNASDMNGNPLSINGWTDIPASKWYEKAKVTRPQGRMISYPKKSWVVLHNKNNARVNLQSMSILGDVVYKDTEHQIVMPLMAENPEEVTLKYAVKSTRTETGKIYRYDGKERAKTETTIADDIAAGDFSKWYYNSVVKGKDKVTWTDVGEGYSHDVGDYVYAQFEGIGGSDNIGRGIACIIVQKHLTMGEVVKCEYTALSVSDFVQNPDAYEIAKKRQIQTVKPSSYQQAIENGTFTGSEIEWVESLAKDVVDNSPAPSVDFSQSSLTFIRNNRSRDYDKFDTATYNAYSFGINVSGIDASKYSIIGWTFNGITPDEQASSEGYYFEQEKSISIRVKLKGMSDKITVFVWYKILGVTYSHEYVMEVDDKTTDATYFGRMDALPDSTENYKYIDNDMLVLKGEDDSREAYIFSGGSWRRYEESDTNYNVALDAVKDVLGGNNHVEANGFDWFGKLMANTVVANEMFAKGLESPAYAEESNGFPSNGFNMKENKVKIFDLLANKGSFYDVNIEGDSSFNGTLKIKSGNDVILKTQNYIEQSFTASGNANYGGYYLKPYEFWKNCTDNIYYESGRYLGKAISKIGYYTSDYSGDESLILDNGKIYADWHWYEVEKNGNVAFKIHWTDTESESLNFRIYEKQDSSSQCYINVYTRTQNEWFEYGAKKGQYIVLAWSQVSWFGRYSFDVSLRLRPASYMADNSFTSAGLNILCSDGSHYNLGKKGTNFGTKTELACNSGDYLHSTFARCYNRISGFSISGEGFPGIPISATRVSGTLTITDYDSTYKTISNVTNIAISSAIFSDTMLAFYDTNGIRYEIEVGQGLRGFSFSLTNRGVSNKGIRTKNIFADNIVGMIVWMPIQQAPVGFLMCNGGYTTGYPILQSVVGNTLPNISSQTLGGVTVYPYMYAGISGSDE